MKRCLVIVAHPDDETIWMGGMILKHKEWNWTIFSLCRKNDSDRAPKFMKVCEYYGAKGIIGDLDDEVLEPLSIEDIINKIKEFLKEKNYDYIFTHGVNGEYGHLRHKEIHNAVNKMIEEGELKCEKLYCFDYKAGKVKAPHDSDLRIPEPSLNAEEKIQLNESQFKDKFKLITEFYGFRENIFETLSCHKMESFRVR